MAELITLLGFIGVLGILATIDHFMLQPYERQLESRNFWLSKESKKGWED